MSGLGGIDVTAGKEPLSTGGASGEEDILVREGWERWSPCWPPDPFTLAFLSVVEQMSALAWPSAKFDELYVSFCHGWQACEESAFGYGRRQQ